MLPQMLETREWTIRCADSLPAAPQDQSPEHRIKHYRFRTSATAIVERSIDSGKFLIAPATLRGRGPVERRQEMSATGATAEDRS